MGLSIQPVISKQAVCAGINSFKAFKTLTRQVFSYQLTSGLRRKQTDAREAVTWNIAGLAFKMMSLQIYEADGLGI